MPLTASRAYHAYMVRSAALLFALALSAPAPAAIYKWVDENGTTVYSNTPPENPRLAKQAKVVVKDEAPTPASEAAAREANARREQELLERIARLERELADQRYTPPMQYAPPPVQYVQPPADYYPPYYYPGAVYPGAVIVRPASRFVRSLPGRSFVSRGFHHSHRR